MCILRFEVPIFQFETPISGEPIDFEKNKKFSISQKPFVDKLSSIGVERYSNKFSQKSSIYIILPVTYIGKINFEQLITLNIDNERWTNR